MFPHLALLAFVNKLADNAEVAQLVPAWR